MHARLGSSTIHYSSPFRFDGSSTVECDDCNGRELDDSFVLALHDSPVVSVFEVNARKLRNEQFYKRFRHPLQYTQVYHIVDLRRCEAMRLSTSRAHPRRLVD